jgi:KaiC protein
VPAASCLRRNNFHVPEFVVAGRSVTAGDFAFPDSHLGFLHAPTAIEARLLGVHAPMDEQQPDETGAPISTGIPGLDNVLCGGLDPDRLYLVEGEPGTGKTTMPFSTFSRVRVAGRKGCTSRYRKAKVNSA